MILSEFHLGWIAGLVDGEGCITIMKRPAYRDYGEYVDYSINVVIAGTSRDLIEEIRKVVGYGSVYTQQPKGNRKQCWRFVIFRRDEVRDFLLTMAPYLIVKNEQAQLAVRWLDLKATICPSVRADMHRQMMVYNKRGLESQNGPQPDDSVKPLH